MPRRTRKADHGHGRSEIHERPELQPVIDRAKRRLGLRLLGLRKGRKLTLEQAAERIGVHPNHLQRIEAAKANVTISTLAALSFAYGVPLHSLFDAGAATRSTSSR